MYEILLNPECRPLFVFWGVLFLAGVIFVIVEKLYDRRRR